MISVTHILQRDSTKFLKILSGAHDLPKDFLPISETFWELLGSRVPPLFLPLSGAAKEYQWRSHGAAKEYYWSSHEAVKDY